MNEISNWEKEFDKKFPQFKNRAFTEDTATIIKSFILSLLAQKKKEHLKNIGFLRQWLNEDRKCTPMVTNEDIKRWLTRDFNATP